MSTRDENIPTDLLFFNEFYHLRYPDKDDAHRAVATELLLNGEIQIETFIENAVAVVGGLSRASGDFEDLSDGSEVKKVKSSFRNNHQEKGQWMHSYEVQNIHAKTGPVRVVGYNILAKKFEFYFIPNHELAHLKRTVTLPIETASGWALQPDFDGIRKTQSKWDQFLVPDFKQMCLMRA